jgi:His/Glu/Gln/Arg/opine family amino acid ABC transporter permease subunit
MSTPSGAISHRPSTQLPATPIRLIQYVTDHPWTSAAWLVLVGSVLIVILFWRPAMRYQPDLSVVSRSVPALMAGLQMTIYIASMSMVFAMVLALIVAFLRISPIPPLAFLANCYVQFFRGLPQYVFILWLYYGIAILFGINFPPVTAGVIALSVQYAAYMSETYRAGIQAIHKGQMEAGLSVGLSRPRIYQRIVLPQAFRIIIPPLGNSWISILKDSALVSVIGVGELMRVTDLQSNFYFRPFEFFTTAALIYVVLTFVFARGVSHLEQRLKI